jgi:hypothetical protein
MKRSTLTLVPRGYSVGTPSNATVTIADNDVQISRSGPLLRDDAGRFGRDGEFERRRLTTHDDGNEWGLRFQRQHRRQLLSHSVENELTRPRALE